MNIDADYSFIWDVDGTLIDSYPCIVESLCQMTKAHGVTRSKEEIHTFIIERSGDDYLTLLSEETGVPKDRLKKEKADGEAVNEHLIELIPNVMETMRGIAERGGRNFLFTNRGLSVDHLMERLGIARFFDEIVTTANGFPRKPCGDGLVYLVNKYGLDPEKTYYVGDRTLDVDAAVNAGIKSILFLPPDSLCKPNGKQDITVEDLIEIVR